MARKKLTNEITLNSWDECDHALKRIGENNRDVIAAENIMNEQIASAKAIATERTRAIREETAKYEAALERFALSHRADFGNAKTKLLNFGSVSFRQSTKVKLPADKSILRGIIDRMRQLKMDDCIKQTEPKIDKDALRKYGPMRIAELGGTLSVEETFGYELSEIEIRNGGVAP